MKHRIVSSLYLITIACSAYYFQFSSTFWLVFGLSTLLYLFIVFLGVVDMRYGYFMSVNYRFPQKKVLLTFDDGPDPRYTPQILATLEKEGIAALFFLIGNKVEQHPELVQQLIMQGSYIGNHTQNHLNFFATAAPKTVATEMQQGQATIQAFSPIQPPPFRPPIGFLNPIIVRTIKKMKVPVIGWTYRSRDTALKDGEVLKRRLLQHTKPGSILLLHDTQAITADMLLSYIQAAKKNGIIFANSQDLKQFLHES